jgi:hypothetical protein
MMNGIKLWKGFAPPFLPLQDVFVIYIWTLHVHYHQSFLRRGLRYGSFRRPAAASRWYVTQLLLVCHT